MKAKNSILLYLCVVMGLCMTIASTQAQSSTHTGNITVSTQAEVDALLTTLAGKTIIAGDLTIGYTNFISSSDITDLTPLSNIVHIKRNLVIRQNEQLVNLNGLRNLQTITGGDFRLEYNDRLTTVDFPLLETIAGYFDVNHNDRLTTLGNFPVLQTMGRFFRVWENDRLTTLGNFPVLRSISEHFSVFENNRLTTLGNFPVLTSIGLGFYNVYVPTLFRKLNRVSLVVEYNSSLSDCYTLREFLSGRVHAVRGDIYINNNATNGDCNSQNGIINSIYQGNITATTQAQVNALRDTLAGKTTIRGNLTIGYTDNGSTRSNITDLTPLRNIVRMTENLSIQQNGQLVNINGLNNLQIIEGYFSVQNNDSLTTLDFPALMSIGMNDGVNIPSEDQVTDSVSIVVEDNPILSTCCVLTDFFLDGVNAVSGDIFINDNAMGCNSESDIDVITLTLTSSDETIAYNDTDFIAIDFTVGCGATGWTSAITYSPANANFITLSSRGRTGQTGVITLMATPTANTGVERTATISLSTTGGTASQTVVITQEVLPDYVYLGDITVSTQAAVNALSDTLAGKTRIRGNLIIGYEFGFSRSSITDLTPLSNITHITGNLIIRRNGQLVNLNELNNLQTITGGDFRLEYNDRLTTVDFLVLETIEGSFEMNDNNQLTTLGNFPVLQTIGRFLYVHDNDRLTTLGNFPALQSISEHFSVFENNRLTTLGNFPALQSISEHFSVFENNRLTTLGNFSVLMSIGVGYNVYIPTLVRNVPNVSVVVEYNPELPDDSVRSELMKFLPGGDFAVSGDIFINRIKKRTYLGNITVTTQAAVNALRTTLISTDTIDGDLTIGYTDTGSTSDITDLTPLGNIAHITGNLTIQQNGQLVRQKSLTNLQTIGGYFSVSNNDRLIAFDFSKLQTIGGYFSVSNNARLTAFDFSKLQTIGGYFQMNDNARLTAFDFSKLRTIEGYFQVFQNANLSTLGNFSRLQTIEGYVNVSNHDALTTLGSFPVLDSIRGYFSVTNNDSLTTLGSFPALMSIGIGTVSVPSAGQSTEGVSILVENNPELFNCSVLTNFLSGEFYAVSGDIFINANTIGCNSPSTINPSNISRVYFSDITVRTQAELNALRATLKNIDTIEGNVTIGYHETGQPRGDITDLTPFGNIVHITGNLFIYRNRRLVTLNPLTDNLQTIGGHFDVLSNTRITTLDFPVLQAAEGRLFRVVANDSLTTLNFPVLDSIKGHVQILQSAHLNFPVLQTIEGNLEVVGNNTLNFPVLQTIEGYLAVQHSDILTTLDFPVLDSIGGFFQVNYNDRLTTLNFPVLQTIGRYFQVNENHKLTTLGVFPALEIIEESFIVRGNSRLTTLGNFPVLTSIGEHLTTLSVSVRVENNSSLSDCYILTEFLSGRVHAVKGSIYIRNNATDGGCNSQSDILSTVYRKDITVSTQAEVNALRTTLTNIDSIDGNLTIGYTDDSSTRSDITDLTPLTNIVHITENLIIQQNGQLVNLNALNNLQTIGESFRVRNNDSLTTLGNFPALTSIGIDTGGESILVERNPSLSTCCVLTDFFLDEVNAVSGGILITGNATGCNGESEINATTLTLTSSNESIAYNDTDSIAIDFIVGCGSTGWTSAITYMPANANFITLSSTGDANQTGAVTLMATPTANTGAARTATITLSTTGGTGTVSQTVVITQAETPHTLTLTSRNMTIAHDATTASDIIFNVGGGATGWRSFITYTPSGANFITLAPVMNAAQTGEVTMRTTLTGINTGVERTATITLTTTGIGTPVIQRIVITQQSPPTIMLSTSNQTIAYSSIDPIDISFTVGGSATGWTSAITYTPADANFITFSPTDGTDITSVITIMATPMENMGNERSATITFITSEHLGDPVTAEVTITQAGAPGFPTLEITTPSGIRDTVVHTATTASDSVEIVFAVGGGALGWTSMISYGEGMDEFITLSNTANVNQTGEVRIKAAVTKNGEFDRSATIILSTTGQRANFSAATSTITITQLAPVVAGPPSLMVSTFEDTTINHETGALAITFTLGGRAKGWTGTVMGDNFITLDRLMNASDSNKAVTIMATYEANMAIYGRANTRVEREDKIILVTTNGVADTVVITQKAIPVYTGNVGVASNRLRAVGSGDLPNGTSIDFTNITTIDGDLTIESTARNIALSPLSGVTKITGSITMERNNNITNLSAFSSLDTLGDELLVSRNTALTSLGSFPALESIGERFFISDNASLTTLGSFPELETVGDRLLVRRNTALTSLGSFPVLVSIGEHFFISNNASLTTLGSFPELETVSQLFRVDKNDSLTSLGNFPSLMNIGNGVDTDNSLRVTGNAMLSNCNLLAEFLPGGMYDVSPGVIILGIDREDSINNEDSFNNAVGCRTVEEITNAAAAVPHTITLITPTGNTTIDHDVVVAQTIRFNVGGGATGWTSAITGDNFITLNPAMNDAQTGDVMVMATPTTVNMGPDDRSATITFTTMGGTATAATFAITITQLAPVVAAPPTLLLASPFSVTLDHDVVTAQTIRFTVGDATGWTSAITGDNFITLSEDDGNVIGAVTVMAIPSGANTGVERSAMITFTTSGGTGAAATATVTITQSAAPPTLTLPPGGDMVALAHNNDATTSSNIMFTVGGGATGWSSSITYTPAGANFITLNTAMNDAQTGGVTVTATPSGANTGVERSAVITFTSIGGTGAAATATVTITQAAAPPTLVLTSPLTVMLAHNVVVAQTITFTVGGSASGWTSSMSGDNFITLNTAMNDTQRGVITVMATPTANTGVERSATITFTTSGGTGDAATATVTIRQEAAPPAPKLMLTSNNVDTLAHDDVSTSNIEFSVANATWTARSSETFVTLSPANGTTNEAVTMTVTASGNTTGSLRTATITITATGTEGTIRDTVVMISQEAAPTLNLTSASIVNLAYDAITAEDITFTLEGSADGWTATSSNGSFITVSLSSGTGTAGVIMVTVLGTSTGSRTSEITITTEGSLGTAVTETVRITQEAAPVLSVDESSLSLGHDVVDAQNIVVTSGGSATGWTASSVSTFVVFTTSSGVSGGSATFTLSSNDTELERTAEIVITTEGSLGTAVTATVRITQEEAPTLSVDESSFSLGHDVTGEQTIMVTSGGSAASWTASSVSGFVTITTSNGGNGNNATFTLTSNDTGSERTAEIVITTVGSLGTAVTETVTITQEEAPTITLSTSAAVNINYDVVAAQTITFNVGGSATGWTSNIVYTPALAPGVTGFITLTPAVMNANQRDEVTLMATPDANTGAARTATITFSTTGQLGDSVTAQVTITQGVAPNAPTLGLTSHTSGDTVKIDYNMTTATAIAFMVGGNATGWTASSDNSFVTLSSMGANSTDLVMLMAMLTGVNRGVERSATITISTSGPGTSPDAATLTITQGGAAPVLTFIPVDETIAHSAESASNITFNVGGGAMGWTSSIAYTPDMSSGGEEFITLMPDNTGAGNIIVTVRSTVNTTGVERSAEITIRTKGGTGVPVTKTVMITQEAVPTLSVDNSSFTLGHDEGDVQNIVVTSGGSATGWTASSVSGFVTFTTSSGVSGGSATFTLSSNDTRSERTVEIIVMTTGSVGTEVSKTVMITQEAAPTLSVDISSFSLGHDEGDAQNIVVSVGGSATEWNARSDSAFVDITTSSGGNGDSATFTLSSNDTGSERTSEIVITTDGSLGSDSAVTVMITQAAAPAPGAHMLMFTSASTVDLAHDATTAENITFTLGGSAEGWTATSSDTDFITVLPSPGTGIAGVIMVTVVGTSTDSRTSDIEITTTGSTGVPVTKTVMITQEAVPTLSVDNSSFTLGHDERDVQNIVVSVGGSATEWNARSDSAFVDITTSNGGNGDSATFTLSSNDTGSERTSEIVITTDGSLGSDSAVTVMITQSAEPAPGTHTLMFTSASTVTLAHGATTAENITFTLGGSAEGWTATSSDTDFITVLPSPGTGIAGAIMVTVAGTSTDSRTSDIEITTTGSTGVPVTKTVTITQEAVPTLSVDNSSFSLGHDEGAAQNIVVTLGGSATGWNASSDSTFVMFTTSSGVSGGSATFTLSSNDTGSERTAEIVITTDGSLGSDSAVTVMITQSAEPAPGTHTLMFTSASTVTLAHGATTAENITFTLGGSAEGWTATSSDTDFITVLPSSGTGIAGVIMVTVVGTSTDSRTSDIEITTTGSIGTAVTKTVTIMQEAAPVTLDPATLMVSTFEDTTINHDATGALSITFMLGGTAKGWTGAVMGDGFITLNPAMSTSDTNQAVTIMATPGENAGVERKDTIVFTTGDVADTVVITQSASPALPPALTLSSGNTDTLAHGAGSTSTIEFSVANATWEAKSSETFVRLDMLSGNAGDNLMVMATAEANTGAKRMATITITATDGAITLTETVTITQETAPTIMLTSHTNGENIAIAYDNTDLITIGFTLGGSAKGWGSAITYTGTETNFIDLSLTEGTNPTGMITITATPIENIDVKRSATIIFMTTGHLGDSETAEVMITQAGAPGSPTLEIIPPSGVRDTVAYTATTALDSVEIVFTLGNATGWASMISYGVGMDDFITLSDRSNADQTGEVRIKAAVMENEGMERSATITLNTTGQRADFSAATREITIIQRGAPPTLMLTSHTDGDSIAIIHDDTNSITISFTFGGSDASSMSSISYVPENANFITLEPENNDESTRAITITPSANTSTVPRTATITLITTEHEGTPDSVSLTIVQAAAPNIILLFLPNGFTIPIAHNNTDSRTINFTLGGSATSSMSSISYVPENANFITLEPENNDESTRAITLTPTANTTAEPRTATITLITAEHAGTPDSIFLTIMQGAAPVLELISGDISIAHDATHAIPIFTVGGSATGWRSTITYTPRDVAFITLSDEESTDQPNGMTIMATPTVNTRGDRTATITLRTTGHVGTPVRRTLTITQAAAPTLMLTDHTDGDSIAIAHNNTDPITIDFTLGGSATSSMSSISYMPENANFITLEPENNDESTRTITITPSANTSAEPRTATITLRTTGHEGTPNSVSLTITQDGAESPLGVAPSKPFTLYPNPTKGTLTIEGVTRYLQMYIYDLVGREVMTYSLTPSKKTVDVSDLPSGMYVVTLQGEGKTWKEVLMKR